MTLHALLVALLPLLPNHAGRSREATAIVAAIEQAAAEDCRRGYVDCELEATTLAYYAAKESGMSTRPRPVSWDSRAGVSCGAWQLACAYVESHSVVDQAREWLRLVHAGGLPCVSPSASRARARLSLAMGLVGRITSADDGVAATMPP